MAARIEGMGDEVPIEVAGRLESGEAPDSVARSMGLEALGLIAAIARLGLGGEGSEGPGLVHSAPARPKLAKALSETSLSGLLPGSSRPSRLALSAGLLQILDHWEASHAAAQEGDDLGERVGSAYWHMIAHRREPDPGNAHYWARRVGRHAILGALAEESRPLLEAHGDPALSARLIGDGAFRPPSMIDFADRARPGSSLDALARRLQRVEMILLLDATVRVRQEPKE
ncbi:DUF433 domain-containing protein [Tundrisphaera lichenicola]|uniref:DUF433 domain-containing protein n=1 Tax=Tundrisphaera lichenicola TaxID=2029860 RepID=UPI003EBFCEA4